MATTLTFQIGRRPGIDRRRRFARRSTFGMSAAQRVALAELIRSPGEKRQSDLIHNRSRLDFVWPAVLALAFVLGSLVLFEGVRSVEGADRSHTATRVQPQVDIRITRVPPVIESAHATAPDHSSTAASRTM